MHLSRMVDMLRVSIHDSNSDYHSPIQQDVASNIWVTHLLNDNLNLPIPAAFLPPDSDLPNVFDTLHAEKVNNI